jgi:hypothetical protein
MQNCPVRIFAALQMMTLMPWLAARLATRAPPQAALLLLLSRRLVIPIRRRRLGRVARVPIKPRTKLRDQRLKLADPRSLHSDQRLKLGIRRAG